MSDSVLHCRLLWHPPVVPVKHRRRPDREGPGAVLRAGSSAQPPEVVEDEVDVEVVWRWACPLLLATSETQSPMPWVWAAEAEALQRLTAAVTTEPWLLVLLLSELSELLSLLVSLSLDE